MKKYPLKLRIKNAWQVLKGRPIVFVDFQAKEKKNVCKLFDTLPERPDGYITLIHERIGATLAELEQYEQLAAQNGDFKSAALLRDKIKEGRHQ